MKRITIKARLPVAILILTFFIYVIFAGRLNFEFPTHPSNYFSHLSSSFLSGRLDIPNVSWDHDLSIINGKKYMYWGPTPILLILPFVGFFGLNISDALYAAIIASFSPLILYLILKELDYLEIAQISDFKKLILTIFFGFGTVYFVLAVNGGVWFTSQAISTLYILISLLFVLKFKRHNSQLFLIISSIFLCLGIWGRISFIFSVPFFIYVVASAKNFKNFFLSFILICSIFFGMFSFYNYIRFHSIFETGYSLSNMAPGFAENNRKYGSVNTEYFSTNLYYLFQHFPLLKKNFPYLEFDYMGNSLFSTSPLFILLIMIFKKDYWRKSIILFNLSALICIATGIGFFLLYLGTGSFQFGTRYLMDVIPLTFILLAQIVKDIPAPIILILCLISVYVNLAGVLWFLNIL